MKIFAPGRNGTGEPALRRQEHCQLIKLGWHFYTYIELVKIILVKIIKSTNQNPYLSGIGDSDWNFFLKKLNNLTDLVNKM